MKEIYISIDIEADGPIPGPYSMISLGAAAFMANLTEKDYEYWELPLSTFQVNLKALPGATEHPETMEFWDNNVAAYNATTIDQVDPKVAIDQFVIWVSFLEARYGAKAVLVGYPGGYDFMFLQWYLVYAGYPSTQYNFSILDIKSYAMAMLKRPYIGCTKKNMPKRWKTGNKSHTHIAVDDAEEQGRIFMRMLLENSIESTATPILKDDEQRADNVPVS